jgi:hypothetical protein
VARGAVARGGRLGEEEEDDRWGPGVSGGERKGTEDGMREIKEKTYFVKYAIDAWAERLGPGCGRRLGPGSREAAWAGRQAKAGGVGRAG